MNYFQRYLAEEFAEDYEEGRISRRKALKLIASVTGSLIVANSILASCTPPPEGAGGSEMAGSPTAGAAANTAEVPVTGATETAAPTSTAPDVTPTGEPTQAGTPSAAATQGTPGAYGTVSPDDPSIQAGPVEFPGQDGAALMGYQASPQGDGPFAVVLVCHENRGLTPHIEDVTRRLAKAGYAALAVDLLSRSGGTQAVGAEEVPGVLGNTPPEQFVQDFKSGWQYLQTQPQMLPEQVGMVGFCFGGGVTWRVAVEMPELRAAVPFYGPHPPVEDVPRIQAPVLAIYGGLDQRINQGIPAIEQAMQQNNKTYEKVIYENADHAFHNDTGQRYNAEAARDAWARTLAWFERYLT